MIQTFRTSLIVLLHLAIIVSSDRLTDEERPPNEAPATNQPVIVSPSRNMTVHIGETVSLPCEVTDLDPFVLVWRKGLTTLLYAGTLRVTRDDQIMLEQPHNQLVFNKINTNHSGEYVCVVSTTPQKDISYHLKVIELPHDRHPSRPGDHAHKSSASPLSSLSSMSAMLLSITLATLASIICASRFPIIS